MVRCHCCEMTHTHTHAKTKLGFSMFLKLARKRAQNCSTYIPQNWWSTSSFKQATPPSLFIYLFRCHHLASCSVECRHLMATVMRESQEQNKWYHWFSSHLPKLLSNVSCLAYHWSTVTVHNTFHPRVKRGSCAACGHRTAVTWPIVDKISAQIQNTVHRAFWPSHTHTHVHTHVTSSVHISLSCWCIPRIPWSTVNGQTHCTPAPTPPPSQPH